MKLVTTKQALVECLAIVNKAVSSRSSIQVLSGVLVDAREGGTSFSATDMEISIKAPLAAQVEQTGSLVLPARIATDIARSLPAGAVMIEQTPGETQVQILRGGVGLRLCIPCPLPTFRNCRRSRASAPPSAGRPSSRRSIARPSASRDETRPVLTGVLVQFTTTHWSAWSLPTATTSA